MTAPDRQADEQGATLDERANRLAARLLRVVKEVERRHGHPVGLVFINIFGAGVEDQLDDGEVLPLLTELRDTGQWERAADRLDAVGWDWTRPTRPSPDNP